MTRTGISRRLFPVLMLLGLIFNVPTRNSKAAPPPAPLILAHYLPWFEAKPINSHWGWHWTMNHFNPDVVKDDRRQIASHDYPLIGPYDSSDPAVLEYHALLMKIAGIDGVVIDWYGSNDFQDYGVIHRDTMRWIVTLKRFGLRYAICYEDQAVKHMVDAGFIKKEQALDRGTEHLRWLDTHAFNDPAYLKFNGKPFLPVYGPQYFQDIDWKVLFSRLAAQPAYFSLDNRRALADGSFAWPPMWKSGGKTLTPAILDDYLNSFSTGVQAKMGLAVPAFHDIYKEAGVGPSYGFLDGEDETVFARTLNKAVDAGFPFVQIATWNDFGEGTNVEPALESGYRYLEILQGTVQTKLNGTSAYRQSDLRLPILIYRMRKRSDAGKTKKELDVIVQEIIDGKMSQARNLFPRFAPPSSKPASSR